MKPQLIKLLRESLGEKNVLTEDFDIHPYSLSTGEYARRICAVLRPHTVEQVVSIVKLAVQFKFKIYPISTGKNWGYGTALPVAQDSVILDLSLMKRIIDFDAELGIVTLEPGVTQADLFEYIEEHKLPFLVPTTGAGPTASILGNILERGYGLAPYTDHFSALTSLHAVLPDGSLYTPALAALGAEKSEKAFKYGLGPYLDGIFTQGSFGIVTQVSLVLKQKPQKSNLFVFWVEHESDLERAVDTVRQIEQQFECIVPTIKMVSQLRSFAISHPYPEKLKNSGGTLDPDEVAQLGKRSLISPWVCIGIISGDSRVVSGAQKGIKKILRKQSFRSAFFSQGLINIISWFGQRSPFNKLTAVASFARLGEVVKMFNGQPGFTEHHIDYWKSSKTFPRDREPDPARDRTGLFWYSPLVPMKAEAARSAVNFINTTCREFGLEPLVTMTALSSRCFDITTYLLFDADDLKQVEVAHRCYEQLFLGGQKLGFIPYRLGIDFMDLPEQCNPDVWNLVNKIKDAVDPFHIIAPGRYCSVRKK